MPENSQPLSFLRTRPAQIATLVLILQAITLYGFSRRENVPLTRPLAEFPLGFAGWRLAQEGVVEKDVMDILKADDLLNRVYSGEGGAANLFVALFKSQRTGQAPHSPKNCLPGSGWVPEMADTITIDIPHVAAPLQVNRYVVQKGDQKSLVLYWYQSRDRSVANEYEAKFYVIADAIRYNRTDTALIRIVVPVVRDETEAANALAAQFVRDAFPPLRQILPQ